MCKKTHIKKGSEKMKIINNELLFEYIKQTGLNYSDISKKTAISRNTLYNIMWGRNCPSYSVMTALADYLEFTQAEFIDIFFPAVNFKDKSLY